MVSSGNVVALTFDAGANADWVASILATLERTCTPATFFLTGRWVEQFQDQARRIAVRHPIGNHSDSHPPLPTIVAELKRRGYGFVTIDDSI